MIPAPPLTRAQLRTRFLVCVVAVAVAFSGLGLRLVWLQVVQGSRYRYLSENNRVRLQRFVAPRGVIFDRGGEVLADVQATFEVLVVPGEIPRALQSAVYAELARILSINVEEVANTLDGPGPPNWRARVLARQITRSQMAQLEAHRIELPGVVVQPNPSRRYPFAALLGPTIGYVGEVSARELSQPAYAEYEAGDYLGRNGLEWAWESRLRGEAGGEQVEVDVQGRRLSVLAERPAIPGHSLVLAVDRRVQQAAEDALGSEVGAAVALEVETGDVVAIVSRPSFDPNLFVKGISPQDWTAISTDPLHPFQNRGIQGLYPPGSTFKIPVALAGLAEGLITTRTRVNCTGEFTFGGRSFRCWSSAGHGTVDLETALAQSCDVYFYQLGLALGVDTIQKHASSFGLGQPTGIDLPGERQGLLPTKEWKRRVRKQPWYQGETLSVAIGQGYVLTTPLQLASMIAAVAHPHGVRMVPRLVTRIDDAEGKPVQEIPPREAGRLPFQRTHLDAVRQGLRMVVAGQGGTGAAAEVAGFAVAGKTGTSQVVGMTREGSNQDWLPWERRDHALFVCYAPADAPKVAVAVIVEHGGHGGSAAAPIAKAIVEAYRDVRRKPAVEDPVAGADLLDRGR